MMLEIALLNGAREIELPWYHRALYPAEMGYWNVNGPLFVTKVEVVFSAAPESEFLDYRLSAGPHSAVNGWALYRPNSPDPVFYGAMVEASEAPEAMIVLNRATSLAFNLAIDLRLSHIEAKYAALWALFNMPRRHGHDKSYASLIAEAKAKVAQATSYTSSPYVPGALVPSC